MKKKWKTIIASSMILSMSILLTGCGSSKNPTLKESLDSGETIWYKVSKTDKDTHVSTIYVFEKNGDMYYASSSKTLGQLEKMDDKDIVKTVKKDYTKEAKTAINSTIKNAKIKSKNLSAEMFNSMIYEMINKLDGGNWKSDGSHSKLLKDKSTHYYEIYNKCLDECVSSYTSDYNALKAELNSGNMKFDFSDESGQEELAYFVGELTNKNNVIGAEIKTTTDKYAKEYADWYNNNVEDTFKDSKNSIKPAKYKLAITSDSTGNNAKSESIVYQTSIPTSSSNKGYTTQISKFDLTYKAPINDNNCFQVYDSYYGMYMNGSTIYCTRTDKEKTFSLDKLGTKGIKTDVKTESLFSSTKALKLKQ